MNLFGMKLGGPLESSIRPAHRPLLNPCARQATQPPVDSHEKGCQRGGMTDMQPPVAPHAGDARQRQPPAPSEFIEEAHSGQPGWSAAYGGPDGVIALTGELLETLATQSRLIAAVRTAAIREQLRTEAATSIAARHHISRQAVSKTAKAARTWEGETW